MYIQRSKLLLPMLMSLLAAACATSSQSGLQSSSPTSTQAGKSKSTWTNEALAVALAAPSRPQTDRDRDGDRKPAQLMTFFGVERGMTVVDVMAAGGYMTEVLSVAVGPTGKVHAQNPQIMLQSNNGVYNKALTARLENNRLANVARLDGDMAALALGSVDVAVTAMNLHDIYNRGSQGPQNAQAFVKSVYDALKPDGVFGVIDHVGVAGGDNAKLHRMLKQQAIDVAKAAGFVVDVESDILARAADDHTKSVYDPALRGKTDQFILRLRKPK